ncbi:MAG: hypothetical protein JWM68_17 [Verrucomicrobiales bacterium]|nr:hypothetical protein [Verrucomicrobiales bacterium]
MKILITLSVSILIAVLTGCTTKSNARQQAREAFVSGQQQAMAQAQQKKSVMFIGSVQNPIVEWTEDLTLASGIVAADFRGRRDPRGFNLRRNGQTYTVTSKQLLQGEDFSLQPGDTIEIVP